MGPMHGRLLAALVAVAGVALAADPRRDAEMSPISGAPAEPRRHFRLRHPAELAPAEAERIYRIVRGALAGGYAGSGAAVARDYPRWRRYNSAPYLSSSHGNHYLNNYGNAAASAYGRFEKAGRLPVGAVIAKDSFSVTETGGILLGPLFVMEKMPAGFNPASGDWRYSLIQPDGTLLGRTNGEGAERVAYCVACHLAAERHDHLYFVPEAYRARPPD